jgi:hypothetical protein
MGLLTPLRDIYRIDRISVVAANILSTEFSHMKLITKDSSTTCLWVCPTSRPESAPSVAGLQDIVQSVHIEQILDRRHVFSSLSEVFVQP